MLGFHLHVILFHSSHGFRTASSAAAPHHDTAPDGCRRDDDRGDRHPTFDRTCAVGQGIASRRLSRFGLVDHAVLRVGNLLLGPSGQVGLGRQRLDGFAQFFARLLDVGLSAIDVGVGARLGFGGRWGRVSAHGGRPSRRGCLV